MMYKFGDKEINTKHVHAIGEPNYGLNSFYVPVYFIGGFVNCEFNKTPEEYTHELNPNDKLGAYRWGLKLKDGSINWSDGFQSTHYSQFTQSFIYERLTAEIEKLKIAIENE